MDDIVVAPRAAQAAVLGDSDVDAIGVDVADFIGVQRGLVAEARLRCARPQHGKHEGSY